jgi:hypothetical protein
MKYVFLDSETTGLDPDRHAVWEVAWTGSEGPVITSALAHNVAGADPAALCMNGYYERFAGHRFDVVRSLQLEELLRQELTGATLVAANPAFDAAFLRARWGSAPWKYRMLDIEAYAMGALGWQEPRGLRDIRVELVDRFGLDIPVPDHSAAGDVATLRGCFFALRDLYEGGIK